MTRSLLILVLLAGCVADPSTLPGSPPPAAADDDDDDGTDGKGLGSTDTDLPDPRPPVAQPTIVLTFDDHFMSQWYAYAPLMKSYGARATFFVTRWDMLSRYAVADLHDLEDRGHEIAHHGLLHRNPAEYVAEFSIERYLEDEIFAAFDLMARDDFFPTSFAYPWGGRSDALDVALLEHFDIVRGSGRVNNPDRILHQWDGQNAINGGRVDSGYAPADELGAAMDQAVAEDAALILYAHRIFDEGLGSHITPAELEQLLQLAADRGMAFATFSELATPRD